MNPGAAQSPWKLPERHVITSVSRQPIDSGSAGWMGVVS